MVRLLGTHGARVGRSQAITGSHNELLHGLCFLYADEALFSGSAKEADALKGMITDGTIDINPKYNSPFKAENYLSIMAATNHEWAIRLSSHDKRNVVLEVSPHRADDKQYFNKLHDWLEVNGAGIFLQFLLSRNIDGFQPEANPPITEKYVEQKVYSLTGPGLWWSTVCDRETFLIHKSRLSDETEPSQNAEGFYNKADIYNLYLRWHDDSQIRGRSDSNAWFWRRFSEWANLDDEAQKRFDLNEGGKESRVKIPSFTNLKLALEVWLENPKGREKT